VDRGDSIVRHTWLSAKRALPAPEIPDVAKSTHKYCRFIRSGAVKVRGGGGLGAETGASRGIISHQLLKGRGPIGGLCIFHISTELPGEVGL
jgi:hypothetical protein